jgi:putative transposase
MNFGGGQMFKGGQFDRSAILLCVRWYLAYGLSLRDLEGMMAERGIAVDHATIHRWVVRYSPEHSCSVSICASGL